MTVQLHLQLFVTNKMGVMTEVVNDFACNYGPCLNFSDVTLLLRVAF